MPARGPHLLHHGTGVLGHAASPGEEAGRLRGVATLATDGGQGDERLCPGGLLPDGLGDLGSVGGKGLALTEDALQHHRGGEGGLDAGTKGGRLVAHQGQRRAERGLGPFPVEVVSATDERVQGRCPFAVLLGITEELEPACGQRDRAALVEVGERALGRGLHDTGKVGADPGLGVGHQVPQLSDPLEGHPGIPVGEHRPCMRRGTERRLELLVATTGDAEVPGQLGGILGVDPATLQEAVSEGAVDRQELARQGTGFDRVRDEGVAQPVRHRVDDQQLAFDRFAHGRVELVGRQAADLEQHDVVDRPADGGKDAQDLLGRVGAPVEPGEQEVGQLVGERAVPVRQLQGVQRVAAGAVHDVAELTGVHDAVAQQGQQGPRVERSEVEPGCPWRTGDGVQQRPRRVPAADLGRPRRHHDEGPDAAEVGDQVAKDVSAGRVAPVDVLDDQHQQGTRGGRLLDHPEQVLHELVLAEGVDAARPLRAQQVGDQAGQRDPGGGADLDPPLLWVSQDGTDRLDGCGVGQLTGAGVEALAAEHARALEPGDEGVDHRALADPRVAGDQDDPCVVAPSGLLGDAEEDAQLVVTTERPAPAGAHAERRPRRGVLRRHCCPCTHVHGAFLPLSGED